MCKQTAKTTKGKVGIETTIFIKRNNAISCLELRILNLGDKKCYYKASKTFKKKYLTCAATLIKRASSEQ